MNRLDLRDMKEKTRMFWEKYSVSNLMDGFYSHLFFNYVIKEFIRVELEQDLK